MGMQEQPGQTREVDVVIVGTGFGGLCMGIKLLEAGHRDFVILEKAADVGGTWRENTYPGAECDVQSHMYSYSFTDKADWSQRYPGWKEIQQYILDTTGQYGLRQYIRFNTEVRGAHFDAASARWTVDTSQGPLVARHVVMASGPLHVPSVPDIPGLKNFQGTVFHSAQWNHDCDLRGKRVVSIGTGGSAIQYCPEIAPEVGQLYVFQRSAAWVIPRDTRKYSALEKKLFAKVPALRKLHRARLYWSNESRVWPMFNPALANTLQNLVKVLIRFQVKDPEVAEKLIPDYTMGCKRVLVSNKWYPMFNRSNVELVTEGIREVRANSIITRDGEERRCDVIILGTGFVVDPRIYMKDFPCEGLPGHVLSEDWKQGAEAYLGVNVSGYPNLFHLVGPNSALGHNSIIFMIECQVHFILEQMRLLREKGADYVNVKAGAQREFNASLQRNIKGTVWASGCNSWYQQDDGRNFTIWPFSTWKYWLRTRQVQAEHFEFVKVPRKVKAVT